MRTRVAKVSLNGVPLGGRISGTGWLANAEAEDGSVVLAPEFRAPLAPAHGVDLPGAPGPREVTPSPWA